MKLTIEYKSILGGRWETVNRNMIVPGQYAVCIDGHRTFESRSFADCKNVAGRIRDVSDNIASYCK